MPHTILIEIKVEKEVLVYKAPGMMVFEPMSKESVVLADPDDYIKWRCADESIKKIVNIQVGVSKPGGGNWKDIWAQKPKKNSNDGREFEGQIKSIPVQPSNPEKDGYDITYIDKNNRNKSIDPQIGVPKT